MAKKKKNAQETESSVDGNKSNTASSDIEFCHIYPRLVNRGGEAVDDPYFSTDDEDEPQNNAPKKSASHRCPSEKDFAKADMELEEMKKESARKKSKSMRIGAAATFLICLIGLLCSLTDASHYMEVPATITNVSVVKHPYSIFGSRIANGVYYIDEHRATVQYYFDSVEYQSSIKVTSTLYSEHTTIYCNKNNPQKCRSTLYWWPSLHKFFIAGCIAGMAMLLIL